jgi:hypothetical protein
LSSQEDTGTIDLRSTASRSSVKTKLTLATECRPFEEVTNYDSLGALIDKYNADVLARHESLSISPRIVDVRDLLAHGRVALRTLDLAELAIVKFDRPSHGKVVVVARARMTDSWFGSNIKLAYDLMINVHAAYERFAV